METLHYRAWTHPQPGDLGDIDKFEHKHGEATVGEMTDDEDTIDTEHDNVTEPTQAKSCYKVEN